MQSLLPTERGVPGAQSLKLPSPPPPVLTSVPSTHTKGADELLRFAPIQMCCLEVPETRETRALWSAAVRTTASCMPSDAQ